MSEKYSDNLIDLNNEDDNQEQQQNCTYHIGTSSFPSSTECHLINAQEESESYDNNPFDFAQKLATRPQDPFDIVEKEACVKAQHSMQKSKHEVKMGKLLSLSDDNILNDESPDDTEKDYSEKEMQMGNNCNTTILHTAILHDLESESPPISMSIKSTPDTCSSANLSDESSVNSVDGYSAKLHKALESRKRLLKLSITNSTFNSPLSCRSRQSDTAFSAAAHFSDQMLATESPLKLVEDDFITEEPPKISDAEQDFEADLKMLSIPMLRKLPSPVPEETSLVTKEINEKGYSPQNITPPEISALREKLRAKRIESEKVQNVVILIDKLKTLLCGGIGNDVVDENNKDQANSLLQKLSLALNAEKTDPVSCDEHPNYAENVQTKAPQSIVRQGTFDMELQPPANDLFEHSTISSAVSDDISRATHSLQSIQSLSPPKEIPEAMLKSSATYDSEPVTERENLLLPHVETISPIASPNTIKPNLFNETESSHPDLNDIIEQISELFEQHQITSLTANNDGGNDLPGSKGSQTSTICKPTFIVVMPTSNLQSVNKKSLNSSTCDEVLNDTNSNLAMRRRSQSLSLHDKVKIVQLPIRQQTVAEAETSPNGNIESQNIVTNMEIKTPMRTLRRNSFSHGTPHTPLTTFNNGNGMLNTRRLSNVPMQSRYSLGPSKIQDCEFQNQAVVHPIPRAANLNAFKPDLKKRCKQQSAKSSVMISKAPLKAMMPIKKIVPMLTGTMATPERHVGNAPSMSQKASMETSMHLLTISGKISNTSTPMLPPRNSDEKMKLAPSACSTPALTSGITRSNSGTMTKKNSRISNSTPTSKLHQPNTNSSSGVKKRTLPELTKAKSPAHVRNSLGGMPVQAAKGRQSTKLSNIQKPSDSRLSVRSNMRLSCGSTISTNKENKKP